MARIVGVRFSASNKVYYFSLGGLEIKMGDGVIVETIHGQEYGVVTEGPQEVEVNDLVAPLKEVLRLATEQDTRMRSKDDEKVQEAKSVASAKIAEHGLEMKLVDVDFSFDGSKITFYFTADGRVDFRALVKDLAGIFRTRIELRQIGVRDEARMIGGLGCCGRPVCCRRFLKDFHPVSIKMAKEQNLSLNPTKISGICGRLMCCLQYEQSTYEALRKELPRVGAELFTPEGKGIVLATQVVAERVRVRVQQPDDSYALFDFHMSEVSTEGPVPKRAPETLPELEVAESWENFTLPEELGGPSESEKDQGERRSHNRNRNRNRGRNAQRNPEGGQRNPEGGQRSASGPAGRPSQGNAPSGEGNRENRNRNRNRRGNRGKGNGPNGQSAVQGEGMKPQSRPNHPAGENRGQGDGPKPQGSANRNRNRNRRRPNNNNRPPQGPSNQGPSSPGPSGRGE